MMNAMIGPGVGPIRRLFPVVLGFLLLMLVQAATAAIITFEDGTDGARISTAIPGIQFTTTQGQDWIYGDWRSGYNGPYPNGSYYSYGNFFAWLGPNQGMGRIDFNLDVAQRVRARYSSYSTVKLEGYDGSGRLIAEATGGGNLNTGRMDTLDISQPGIAYVLMHDSGNYWLLDNLEFELADVEILEVDLQEDTNESAHHSGQYDPIVLRRGQSFMVNVVLTPGFDPNYYDLSLVIKDAAGVKTVATPGSTIDAQRWNIQVGTPQPKSWLPIFSFDDYVVVPVKVYAPYDIPMDRYEFIARLQRSGGTGTPEELAAEEPAYFIFNPWSAKDDDVYSAGMTDAERNAYVLQARGTIYVGETANPKRWSYYQFDNDVFQTTFDLALSLPASDRSNPAKVARYLSRIAPHLLYGSWPADGQFPGGVPPTAWSDSRSIFRKYLSTGQVRYGQCWVFAGMVNSMSRALGIPTRVVTNIGSAHDHSPFDGVITRYLGDNPERRTGESVWNFHVWNEALLGRPDRSTHTAVAWQAIDGTPQELSDGVYQTGPAPVSAVKANAGGAYDVTFVHNEVQATVEDWGYDPIAGAYKLMRVGPYRSEQMPTLDAGGGKADRLPDYCLDCTSHSYLRDLWHSAATGFAYTFTRLLDFLIPPANAQALPGQHQVTIASTNPVTPGRRATGTISITNTGASDDTVNVIAYLKAVSSNGTTIETWDEQRFLGVSIPAGGAHSLAFSLAAALPTAAMPGHDSFVIEVLVFGTHGNGSGRFVGTIAGPGLALSATAVEPDGFTRVSAQITNTLPMALEGLALEATAPDEVQILDNPVVTVGRLSSGATGSAEWRMQLPEGESDVTVSATSDNFSDIYESITLALAGPPGLAVQLNTPDTLWLGAQGAVTVTVSNPGGAAVEDVEVVISPSAGLGGGAQQFSIPLIEPDTSQEVVGTLIGATVGVQGVSASARASWSGGTLNAVGTGLVAVQQGTTVTQLAIDPSQIAGTPARSVAVTIFTDSASVKDVYISGIASDPAKHYAIYDGTARVLAQPVGASSAGKALELRLEEPTTAGWIRLTATPADNPLGLASAELVISGETPLVVVDDRVVKAYGSTGYDRRTQTYSVPVKLRNDAQGDLYGPVRVVLSNIQPASAVVQGSHGTTGDGHPYVQILNEGQVWGAGQALPDTIIRLRSTTRERINLQAQVMAKEAR